MPVAQSRGHAGKALLVAGVGVAVAMVVAWLVAQMASRGDVSVRLGDDRFEAGQVESMAEAIAEDEGLPLLFQDLVGRNRHLYVHHEGEDPATGWRAFGAFDPEEPDCPVALDRDEAELVNTCDRSETYPLDGTGLRQYPTSVEDGRLYVDLNEITTSTTAP